MSRARTAAPGRPLPESERRAHPAPAVGDASVGDEGAGSVGEARGGTA
ncbi:hypothetical protein [Actinomadura chokoriensis]|uniref:Uncharacterized protein n=1 Tax=Actinomadura chokoriensis TaxID=454156 RepID=A0ABV4R3N7_9ACTN